MKIILPAIILVIKCGVVVGQSNKPTIHEVYKIFESSIDQPSKKAISIGAGEWLICNSDSAFYKKDTLKMYNNINYFYQQSNCCKFIGWTFYKKDAFVQSESQICDEPTSRLVKSDNFQFKLSVKNKRLLMLISNSGSAIGNFEILEIGNISLADNNLAKVLTLKRITNTISSP